MQSQKKDLIEKVRDSEWYDKKYEEWINSENEKESLKEITKNLLNDISDLKKEKDKYVGNKSDLSSDNDSLQKEIETLTKTKENLKLEKKKSENKDESSKKSKTEKSAEKSSEKSSKSKKKVVQKSKGKSKKIEDRQTTLLPDKN